MKENRRHRRIDCELPALLTLQEVRSIRNAADITVSDLSESGVRFRLDRFVAVGSPLAIKLPLPLSHPVETSVKPEWVIELPRLNLFEIGASFLSLTDRDAETIRGYIQPRPSL